MQDVAEKLKVTIRTRLCKDLYRKSSALMEMKNEVVNQLSSINSNIDGMKQKVEEQIKQLVSSKIYSITVDSLLPTSMESSCQHGKC